jgi:hypothetical protein
MGVISFILKLTSSDMLLISPNPEQNTRKETKGECKITLNVRCSSSLT